MGIYLHNFPFTLPSVSIHQNLLLPRNSNILRMASSQKTPVIEQQKIVIPNKHGERLVGLLHETGSKEIVILCHGFRCTKDVHIITNLAAAFEREGISSFRFDFSGNGESEGTFQFGNYYYEVDDLHSVTQYFFNANRDVHAIVGHSKGADVVLLYASKYHDIRMVVNVSGRYDMKKGIEKGLGEGYMETLEQHGFIDLKDKNGNPKYRATKESLMERLNTNMHEACQKIDKECRVLTVHGSEDEIIPVEDAREFEKIISNHKLQIVEGADHAYTKHQTELASLVLDFVKAKLS